MKYGNSSKKSKNLSTVDISLIILADLVILWLGTPAISNIPLFRAYVILGIYIIWLFIASVSHRKYLGILVYKSLWFFTWILILGLWLLSGNQSRLENIIIYYIYMFMIYSIYIFYSMKKNIFMNKILVYSVIISFSITSIYTLFALKSNPLISKLISQADSSLNIGGIGNFHYIYAIAILIPCLLIIFRYSSSILKFFGAMSVVLYAFTVFNSGFTIAILLVLITSLFVFIPINKIIVAMSLIILGIILGRYNETVAMALYDFGNVFNSEIVSGRIHDLSKLILGESLGEFSSVGNRWKDLFISVNSFLENPFLGNGAFYGLNHLVRGIGGHSQWIDDLARYGFIGIFPFWVFIFKHYRNLQLVTNDIVYSKIVNLFFIYLFFLGLLNPIMGNQLNIIMFIFIPFVPAIMENE